MKYDCKPLKYFKHNQRVYVPSAQRFGIIKHRYNKILIFFDDFSIEYSPNWCGAISEESYELVQLQQENERLKKQLDDKSKILKIVEDYKKLKKEKQELIEWLNNKITSLEDKTTHTFIGSLGKTIRVNDLIIEELQEVTYKLEGKE